MPYAWAFWLDTHGVSSNLVWGFAVLVFALWLLPHGFTTKKDSWHDR